LRAVLVKSSDTVPKEAWLGRKTEANLKLPSSAFRLPLERTTPMMEAKGPSEGEATLKSTAVEPPAPVAILIADDEPFILRLAQTVLAPLGYRFLLAENGRKALQAFAQNRGAIALAILDQTMPELSGIEVLETMRALDPGVRVLLTSGYQEKDLPPEVREKLSGFLGKPFSPDQLLHAVRAALAAPR
jgi:two-component system, cell cycle sensor histidine kinase and response regulator CckA